MASFFLSFFSKSENQAPPGKYPRGGEKMSCN
jgi:hypothetical protein